MPITVDLEKSPFLREIVEQVRKECTIENIMMVLHARFGRLPNTLNERLLTLAQDQLDRIIIQGATASTFEEVIKVPLLSPDDGAGAAARVGNNRKEG